MIHKIFMNPYFFSNNYDHKNIFFQKKKFLKIDSFRGIQESNKCGL